MGKGEKTKKIIIETAQKLFAEKGYAAVTMKDICEVCGLSRGGLYRHFSSTTSIFIAILENDIEINSEIVSDAIKAGTPAIRILDGYFSEEKAALFREDNGFYFAVHEFAFHVPEQRSYFEQRVSAAVNLVSMILKYGMKTGEFRVLDVDDVAYHILSFWDGLKTSSPMLTITEEFVDRQIHLIKELII